MEAEPTPEALLAHADWVRALARTLVADDDRADEVAQRSLITAIERPPRHALNLRHWLAVVVRNTARRLGRDERLRARREREAAALRKTVVTDDVVAQATLHQQVVQAVLGLAEPYRTAVLLRHFGELALPDVASHLGVPIETVRTRLKRGRALLRQRLTRELTDGHGRLELALAPLWGAPFVPVPPVADPVSSLTGPPGPSIGLGAALVSTPMKLTLATVVAVALAFVFWPRGDAEPPGGFTIAGSDASAPVGDEALSESSASDPIRADGSAPGPTTDRAGVPEASAPVAEETPRGIVLGRVLGRDGFPVADATVIVGDPDRLGAFESRPRLGWSAQGLLRDDEPLTGGWRTRSDRRGRFEIHGVEYGSRWAVGALHAEEGLALITGVPVDATTSPVEIELTLEGGTVLWGRITDPAGDPVAGARINVMGHTPVENGWTSTTVALAETDARGEYRVIPLSYPRFEISLTAEGFLGERVPAFDPEENGEHRQDFQLDRRPEIQGRILGPSGESFGWQEEVLRRLGADSAESLEPRDLMLGVLEFDPAGRLNLESEHYRRGSIDLDEGRYTVELRERGEKYIGVWSRGALLGLAEIAAPDDPPDVTIDPSRIAELPDTGTLEIHPLDAESRGAVVPLQFHLVRLRMALDRPLVVEHATLDDAGPVIRELNVGLYRIGLRSEGYAPFSRLVEVRGGQTTVVRARMQKPVGTFQGIVRNVDAEPVSGARIHVYGPDGELVKSAVPGATNQDGWFESIPLPGQEYVVIATLDGLVPSVVSGVSLEAELDITLEPGETVFVRPTNMEGAFSVRIVDVDGHRVQDDGRTGTSRVGGGQFHLTRGELYTVEIHSVGHEIGRREFRAAEDQVLEIEMEPRRR